MVCVRHHRAQEQLQQRVTKYFVMLTEGCGNDGCVNSDCASYKRARGTPELIPSPNNAAFLAVKLLQEKKQLCSGTKPMSDRTVNGRRRWVSSPSLNGSHQSGTVVGGVEPQPNEVGAASMEIVQQEDGPHVEEKMEMSPQQTVEAIQETKSGDSVMVGTIEMQDQHANSKPIDTGAYVCTYVRTYVVGLECTLTDLGLHHSHGFRYTGS